MLYFNCDVAVSVLCLCIVVPWVGLRSVIVAVPGYIHLFSELCKYHTQLVRPGPILLRTS